MKVKTPQEIESMKTGGKILSEVLWEVMPLVMPGTTELEIDRKAERGILKRGGKPGFKLVEGYNHTICAATNEIVVHGIPTEYIFKPGDVVCIDCGVFYDGLHTDMAETVIVSGKEMTEEYKKKKKFLDTGKKALEEAIKVAVAGNRIGHISKVIQSIVEGEGYSVIRSLVGHGVGHKLHEPPEVPGYLVGSIEKTPALIPGLTIAIEVIYAMGGHDIAYASNDGWTIKTADNSLSAVFERTVLITENKPGVLTP